MKQPKFNESILEAAALPDNINCFIGETVSEMTASGYMLYSTIISYLEDRLEYLDPERDFYKIARSKNAIDHLNKMKIQYKKRLG